MNLFWPLIVSTAPREGPPCPGCPSWSASNIREAQEADRGISRPVRHHIGSQRNSDLTVWLAISAFSCFRVTCPFPRLLRPEIHHIHRPTDLPDVYAGIGLDSHPYDATFDV